MVLHAAYALIEKSVFDQNRHAIAASGKHNEGYEARWNVVLDKNSCCYRPLYGTGSHSFDMHRRGPDDCCGPAGEYVMIRENTFLYGGREGVTIRGKPTEGAFVLNNTFVQERSRLVRSWKNAVSQENVYGNLVVRNNRYEENHQHELALGDFDGDGATDVFWADGRNWWVSRQGKIVWQHLRNSGNVLKDLGFGDFDGNDTTDVFKTTNGKWYVSWNGTSKWKKLNTSRVELENLAFGDFDADGKTDVFRVRVNNRGNTEWRVSYAGSGGWRTINTMATSNILLEDLAFGDFNGDDTTDVFYTGSNKLSWHVSRSGKSQWESLFANSVLPGIPLKNLAFGHFNEDNKTDVFLSDTGGKKWYVWENGSSSFQLLDKIRTPREKLHFGDFNGDGRTDIFMIRESEYKIPNSTQVIKKKTTEWFVFCGGTEYWVQSNPSFDGTIK